MAPRRAWRALLLASAASLAIGCGQQQVSVATPLDSFYFPAGIGVRHVPAGCVGGTPGCQTQLVVVSTNFDLRYDPSLGGTVIAVDVGAAVAAAAAPGAPSPLPVVSLGAVRIGNLGGELTVVDPSTCPGWTGAQVIVASRAAKTLYRIDLDAQGQLTCGPGCTVPLDRNLGDPYDIVLACGDVAGAARALAFVTYLRTPQGEGWVSQLDLLATDGAGVPNTPETQLDVGLAPAGQGAFDARRTRLYLTGRYVNPVYEPLRWIDLDAPDAAPGAINLLDAVRGADPRGIALSSDGTRAYVALRLFDPDVANSLGGRPITDLAAALAVVDITERPAGGPAGTILNLVPLDRGATEVRVIRRDAAIAGGAAPRDLVAVTSADDATLTLYDDEVGAVARTFALCGGVPGTGDPVAPPPCSPGKPTLGVQPFGLAVEQLSGQAFRLYVGSFDRGFVNVIELDRTRPEADPMVWIRIGPERP